MIDFREIVSNLGWACLWISFFVSLYFLIHDRKQLLDTIRSGNEKERKTAKIRLRLLYLSTTVTFLGALGSQWGSEKTDAKILKQETDIRTLSNNLTRAKFELNPLKQPIVSITAGLRMEVRGTNQNTSLDPERQKRIVHLNFGRSEQAKSNIWALVLTCREFEGTRNDRDDKRLYFAEFSTDTASRLWNIGAKDPAEAIDEWDTVVLDASFLSQDALIMRGEVTLIVNSTIRRTFPIPQQRFEHHWVGNTGTGKSVFMNPETNKVNVSVWPYVGPPSVSQ
jgi:hypothetical protein